MAETVRRSFSRPGGTLADADDDPALKRRAIFRLSRWDEHGPMLAGCKDKAEVPETDIAIVEESAKEEETSADEIEQSAYEQIETYINKKNPYEFQDLAAALLRGMGYFTPFVAPAGKDGGVDIVAYRDPLGTSSPRIKVQIKHREASATVQEVRQLMGLLQKDGDVGIFISSGGFTPDAKTTARNSNVHVELVDLPRFITLWQEFYQKLPDEDKTKLPLFPIYLLATTT
jgi:restriction system protein